MLFQKAGDILTLSIDARLQNMDAKQAVKFRKCRVELAYTHLKKLARNLDRWS